MRMCLAVLAVSISWGVLALSSTQTVAQDTAEGVAEKIDREVNAKQAAELKALEAQVADIKAMQDALKAQRDLLVKEVTRTKNLVAQKQATREALLAQLKKLDAVSGKLVDVSTKLAQSEVKVAALKKAIATGEQPKNEEAKDEKKRP